ncbi:MAG: conjugal transfer protein TrbE, partial [Alphaproteobacteria bacterium]|nr:conjugal transfer protein TrbE [Alphaproteobacteria bacterium]
LADFLPIRSIWPGHEFCPNPYYPPNSPPLMVASTTGNTPFRFNIHMDDLGHSLIFGPPGTGKSTFVSILASQFRKYREATVFVFEKGYSQYPLVSGLEDGRHFDIGQDIAIEFCPLAKLETDAQQGWAKEWIVSCLKLQNVEITPEKRNAVKTALHQHRQSDDKSLHDFVVNLQNREMSMALERYTVNDSQNSAILDAESDTLKTSKFNVFELEHLMEMGEDMILPVLTYLFHKIEGALDGQPAIIILDEAWIALGHAVFRSKIREWLKVLRKSNCAVIMATQSISDAANSGILDVINECCPTKIFLPNAAAKDESSTKLYQQLGLNSREIEMLAKAIPKHDYYFRNPEGRRLFNLQLGQFSLAFTGATGKEDLAAIRDLQEKHGKDWVSKWLQKKRITV